MRIWLDTEFIEDGKTIDLISIGMIRDDGKVYYAENAECDKSKASEWVKENVFPHLSGYGVHKKHIANSILGFLADIDEPEFWGYYADYDWVVLCQLYGTMMDLPKGWTMYCRDVKQAQDGKRIAELPKHNGTAHNALDDAIWTMKVHKWIEAVQP